MAENLENWAKKERQEGRQEGWREGGKRLLTQQIRMKFGGLPEWVGQRLEQANSEQLDQWSLSVLTAERW